jgi:hypothetical protein
MPRAGWLCRRVRCGYRNEPAKKKCANCGGPKPKKRVPKHRETLRDHDYEAYLGWNWEMHAAREWCAICGRPPKSRRLDRDHDHATGNPRGLLCSRCNQRLERGGDTVEWLRAALTYVTEAHDYWDDEETLKAFQELQEDAA